MNTQAYDPAQRIEIASEISRPVEQVWNEFTNPDSIIQWNSASPDWHTPRAENDLREGGRFTYRMEARDGSMGFDFGGTYDAVVPQRRILYTMDDGRQSNVEFSTSPDGSTSIHQWFDPESTHSVEQQREGWQNILDSFRAWVEAR